MSKKAKALFRRYFKENTAYEGMDWDEARRLIGQQCLIRNLYAEIMGISKDEAEKQLEGSDE